MKRSLVSILNAVRHVCHVTCSLSTQRHLPRAPAVRLGPDDGDGVHAQPGLRTPQLRARLRLRRLHHGRALHRHLRPQHAHPAQADRVESQQEGLEARLPREPHPARVHAHPARRVVLLHRPQHALLRRVVQAVLAQHLPHLQPALADRHRSHEWSGVDHQDHLLCELLHQLLPVLSDWGLLPPRDPLHVPILLQRPQQEKVADGGRERPAAATAAADTADTVWDVGGTGERDPRPLQQQLTQQTRCGM